MLKRLLLAAAAASLLGGAPALADPGHGHGRGHGHGGPPPGHDNGLHRGWYKGSDYGPPGHRRHWARGEYLPRSYISPAYYVDYRVHHLRPPPPGYRWVRVDGDYVMVAFTTGLIAGLVLGH
jgi:Ni/Co efflux regulator RcnB